MCIHNVRATCSLCVKLTRTYRMIIAVFEHHLVNNGSTVNWFDIIVYSRHAFVTLFSCFLFWCSVALHHSLIDKKLLRIGCHCSLAFHRKDLEQSCKCEVGRACGRCNGRLAVLGGRNNTRRGGKRASRTSPCGNIRQGHVPSHTPRTPTGAWQSRPRLAN